MQRDFMQRQYEVAQQLIGCMTTDIEYQRQLADLSHHYEHKLAQRDRKISKLESTIQAMQVLNGAR
jgi:hypothetical protein